MKKISLLFVCALFSINTLANPLNLFQKRMNQGKKLSHNTINRINTNKYTDFSGTWISQCGDEETLVIQNDDKFLNIDNTVWPISGVTKMGGATAETVGEVNNFIQWDKNGKGLKFDMTGYSIELPNYINHGEKHFYIFMGKGKMILKGEQLVISNNMNIYVDGNIVDSDNDSCTYKKK